jgi:hypothetical protein
MSEAEVAFLREIDCRFPYDDEPRWQGLVDRGVGLSPNAAFAVLYEICNPGRSWKERLKPEQLKGMLDYWRSKFEHPVANVVVESAMARIDGHEPEPQVAIDRLRVVAEHPFLDFALMIVDYAVDDPDDRVETTSNAIVESWKMRASVS